MVIQKARTQEVASVGLCAEVHVWLSDSESQVVGHVRV